MLLLEKKGDEFPLVSIIVSVFNISQYIEKCLISCINQTYRSLEIIVIDDGSTDGSCKIVNDYAKKDKRIVVERKINAGPYWARKTGLEIANGEYVFFLDGDDYLDENAITILYDYMSSYQVDMVCGGIYVDKSGICQTNPALIKSGIYSADSILRLSIANYSWHVWGNLIKRSLCDKLIYWDQLRFFTFGEDAIVMFQLYSLSKKIYMAEENIYYYVQRESSVMHDESIVRLFQRNMQFSKALQLLSQLEIFNLEFRNQITCLSLERLCFCLRSSSLNCQDRFWIKSSIYKYFIANKNNRTYFYTNNKRIYVMLFLGVISPSLAKILSNVRNSMI